MTPIQSVDYEASAPAVAVILHVNHSRGGRSNVPDHVSAALDSLSSKGRLDGQLLSNLDVQLDWIQYKNNFREPISLRRVFPEVGQFPAVEIALDERQLVEETLSEDLARVLDGAYADPVEHGRHLALEPFGPGRSSIIWRFNQLYWKHLDLWEQQSGQSYDQSLPSGNSDANNPGAIRNSVAKFWSQLKRLEDRQKLPQELVVVEIAVGSAERALQWLETFKTMDRDSRYYPRLRFVVTDTSSRALDRARFKLNAHSAVTDFIVTDAADPSKSLSYLQNRVLYIHLTNVYDNLPTDEVAMRDGRPFFVEVRAYLNSGDAEAISNRYGLHLGSLVPTVKQLLDAGPAALIHTGDGLAFWQDVWAAIRLEERLLSLESLAASPFPPGLGLSDLDRSIDGSVANASFQLSSGAIESVTDTLPLLHPEGLLEVMDIFVTDLQGYLHSFRGPGKMDGSVINWVNGTLLAQVVGRCGYDAEFEPFRYREGSRTSILHVSHKDSHLTLDQSSTE